MDRGPKKLFRRRRSTRSLILAASIAAGALAGVAAWLLLRSNGPATGTVASPSASVTSRPSPTASVVGTPKIKGVVVQVLNGTARQGLAAMTSRELARAGYTMASPGNSESPRTVTLITYQLKFGADAAFIQRVYFPHAVLQESFVPFPSGADITVVLGTDVPG